MPVPTPDQDSATDGEVVRAVGLTKHYGSNEAVRSIDFTITRGEVVGVLGPNGAGKSSIMRMVGCVSPRTSGTLSVLGLDPDDEGPRIRSRLGIVPQEDNLDAELSVEQNLYVYASYFALPRAHIRRKIAELLDFVQLADRAKADVDSLSGGMKRRLTIARGLVNDPELVLLDEPTTGLDTQARHLLWEKLFHLKRSGVTLVITTHYMHEAEQLCDRLIVIDKGVAVAEGTPRELLARYSPREVLELRLYPGEQDQVAERLAELGVHTEPLPDRLLAHSDDAEKLLAVLADRDVRYESSLVRRGSLEDVFLHLTGRSLTD